MQKSCQVSLPFLVPQPVALQQGLSSHAVNEEMKEIASCGVFATGALSLQ